MNKIKNKVRFRIFVLSVVVLTSGCLKTRSEVSDTDQKAVYGKKNVENQMEAQVAWATQPPIEEKDELIRNLNGRVEVLENQLTALVKEKESLTTQDSQKIVLLQEALAKMEAQLHKFETEAAPKPEEETPKVSDKSSDEAEGKTVVAKKLGTYESAEQYFAKQEWKKAILNFQKYTDESPRGKNVPDAKYKIGVCFQELGMKEEAMAFYEEVVANHSKTTAGKKSKARLGSLKK